MVWPGWVDDYICPLPKRWTSGCTHDKFHRKGSNGFLHLWYNTILCRIGRMQTAKAPVSML